MNKQELPGAVTGGNEKAFNKEQQTQQAPGLELKLPLDILNRLR